MPRIQVDSLHPLRFDPIFKRLVWGGRKLATVLRKPIGEGSEYAESWEISDHRADVSRVAHGPLTGSSLRDLIRSQGANLFGPAVGALEQFPLLVKFIDARQDLSVQVHPDDERGRRLANDNGKTETWVILHADPGSKIYAGLKPGTTRALMERAVAEGTVEALLHSFEARPGDCVFIPAGTVHAIGAGIVLAEFQQMSDATFRLHDWGRVGLDGPAVIGQPDRFTIVLGVDGEAEVRSGDQAIAFGLGQTILLPASIGPCQVVPRGLATLLTCVVP